MVERYILQYEKGDTLANTKTTDLTALSTVASGDKIHIIDVSDTTDSSDGTNKYITRGNLISGLAASGANSDITSLTGLTTTLTVPQGGSGAATLTGILKGNGTGAFTAVTAPSGALVGDTDTQVLTNKTLTSPVVNTGISGTAVDTDVTLAADSDTLVASQKAIKAYADGLGSSADGWIAGGTWTYASANTITVASGAAAIYQVGDRIKWTQTTVKYGVITGVADTVLTIAVNTDYVVTNAAITLNYYSHEATPIGFPQWFAYTPTGPTNTTLTGRFSVNGRIVLCRIKGAVTGTPAFTNMPTLPITASANMEAADYIPHGTGGFIDTGTANGVLMPSVGSSATICALKAFPAVGAGGGGGAVSPSNPITWANTDGWYVWFNYEI